MVDWCLDNAPPSSSPSILEVGSGNGTLLFGLLEAGYAPSTLAGIDYSPGAVKLARQIASTKDGDDIMFSECDFLNDTPKTLPGVEGVEVWDVVLDKGTYDAIALGDKDAEGRSPAAKYPSRVARVLKPGGYFLITCAFLFSQSTGLSHLVR